MAFWEKVQRGVSSAASEAEKQATVAKLNLELNRARSGLTKKHEELGSVVLGLIRQGELSHPSFEPILKDISSSEEQVSQIEAHLAETRGHGTATG